MTRPSPLVGLGRISYGIYLVHMPVLHLMLPARVGWEYPGNTIIAATITLAVALASYFLIERPFLSLKDRFGARAANSPESTRALVCRAARTFPLALEKAAA